MDEINRNILKRIDMDVVKLINSRHQVISADRKNEVQVMLSGPKGTMYEMGYWVILLTIPDKYPYKSPSVGFLNKIYHPNVDEASGSVCLNVISQTWTALYDLNMIFDTFLPQLLAYPNPGDPLNHEAAVTFMESPESFKCKVKDYIKQYASLPSVTGTPESCNEVTLDEISSLSSISDYEEIDIAL